MTLHQSIKREIVKGVAVGTAPRSLEAIKHPHCAAAIWEREPLAAFQNWIDGLSEYELPKARIILRPGDVQRAMTDLFDSYALAACDARTMLIDDVAALAHIFSHLVDAPFLRLRLDVITTNACRKFHTDLLTARLICTYRGTGTQYGVSDLGAEPDHVLTTSTGSAIVLRGHLWPAATAPDILHRSPPIEGTGEARLVLILDPVTDREDAMKEELLH
ncbi:MAG: DUF1826 domain-containing protein [Pseudomonadota bacterium]